MEEKMLIDMSLFMETVRVLSTAQGYLEGKEEGSEVVDRIDEVLAKLLEKAHS